MHGSMHVSGTRSWKKPGGRRGVLVFEGGVIAPPCRGVGSTLPPPASLPAAVRLNDLRIVPSGVNQAQFPVFFPRNVERDLVADENRRDLRRFLAGISINASSSEVSPPIALDDDLAQLALHPDRA